jgi:hypothetical protein
MCFFFAETSKSIGIAFEGKRGRHKGTAAAVLSPVRRGRARIGGRNASPFALFRAVRVLFWGRAQWRMFANTYINKEMKNGAVHKKKMAAVASYARTRKKTTNKPR